MLAGKVVGHVWSAKKLEQLPAGALLEIELEAGAGTLIALDPLGCGGGERVLICTGSTVNRYFPGGDALVDAVVIASLEASNPKAKAKK